MTEGQPELKKVIYVSWEESEIGLGTHPNGCSLHLTTEDAKSFEKEYLDGMPESVPNEYFRPSGEPVEAFVSQQLYDVIKGCGNGIHIPRFLERKMEESNDLVYGLERSGWVRLDGFSGKKSTLH